MTTWQYVKCKKWFHSKGEIPTIPFSPGAEYSGLECYDCGKKMEKQGHLSDVLSHAKCQKCNSRDKEATEYAGYYAFIG
jgi:DNA-directed RNA polymerase subunit RPC12/RpoP